MKFLLPDVGEGLTEAEIVGWHVSVGDTVDVNDTLVEVETAKSIVELPSPAAGVIDALHADVGGTVQVGEPLVTITEAETEARAGQAATTQPEQVADAPALRDTDEQPLVLVGTGPAPAAARRRHLTRPGTATKAEPALATGVVRASPLVRRLARDAGIDLNTIAREPNGRVNRSDLERAVGDRRSGTASEPGAESETRTPIRGVRKATAAAMVASAFSAPHVTEWLAVDVTRTMDLLARLKSDRWWAGVRITPLAAVARSLLLAIRKFPAINARWLEDEQEIATFRHVNLGIAAATPRGLVVPNIKDADRLDLRELAVAISQVAETARTGKVQPDDMTRGTITITNIGSFGVDAGTPILNPGEAAILALGAIRETPWVVDGQIVTRKVTQLALSFDHRLVDGELGSLVLAEVGRVLSDPAEAFLSI